MYHRLFSLLALAGIALTALAGCARSGSDGKGLTVLDVELSLDEQIALLAATDVTKLNPDYVRRNLPPADPDGPLAAAYARARGNPTRDAQLAVIDALELKFIHDPSASSLDLLGPELSGHFRGFDWQEADYPGGDEGPNEVFADVMVDALDLVRPERRANRSYTAVVLREEATEEVWEYLLSQWSPIPDTDNWKLNRHAIDSFVRMREAAAADGVDLVIKSAHRDPKRAAANAERVGNPYAVASFSAHSLGLAIDFELDNRGTDYPDLGTSPMSDVIRMRESPVHKWLHLRGEEYGWYPFQHEPWHWEYNPPGFWQVFWQDFQGPVPDRLLNGEYTPEE